MNEYTSGNYIAIYKNHTVVIIYQIQPNHLLKCIWSLPGWIKRGEYCKLEINHLMPHKIWSQQQVDKFFAKEL